MAGGQINLRNVRSKGESYVKYAVTYSQLIYSGLLVAALEAYRCLYEVFDQTIERLFESSYSFAFRFAAV
jgi:hypothetical protein